MIQSFRHKGLRRFFETGDRSKLPPEMIERIGLALLMVDEAETIAELNRPGFRLHPLKGRLAGHWSMTITGNWRIIFRFVDGHALDVDFMDYH
jgi:proteic killer suppression protein